MPGFSRTFTMAAGFWFAAAAAAAQEPPPIIDMHLHALPADAQGPPPLAMCTPMPIPAVTTGREVARAFMAMLKNPPCTDPVWSPETAEEIMRRTLAIMERRNVIGVTSGPAALVARWKEAAPDRIIPGLVLNVASSPPTLDELRRMHEAGDLEVLGEITNQYSGVEPSDARFAPYLALAEELDIPVGIHIGTGPPGAPYLGFGDYRARFHSPLGLEEVLLEHPDLRVYVAHAGWPMLDDMLAVLYTHPQVHVDVGVIVYSRPRADFYRYLKAIVDAGFIDRVLFGSDQMVWPETLERAIQVIEEAPFLDEAQKRAILYDNAARFLRLDEPANASATVDARENAFVITGARVFDGERVVTGADVVVRDGRIEALGPLDGVPASVPRVDGTGATLIPGLIDAHVHTQEVEQLERDLRFGVTTVLDMSTAPEYAEALHSAARERSDVADFLSAGRLATAPGGHGTQNNPDIAGVRSPEDAAPFVARQVENGAAYLKVVLSGVRAAQGMPTLDGETVRALVAAGRSHGLVVVAHIETPEDARTAVEAGVDGLAHVWRTPGAPADIIDLLVANDVFVVATLSVPSGVDREFRRAMVEDPAVQPFLEAEAARRYVPPAELDPREQARIDGFLRQLGLSEPIEILNYHLASVAALDSAGVTVLAGADPPVEGVVHGIALLQEIELLVRAGMSPTGALSAATARTADAFGLEDRGRIAPGRRADLVLVEGDPTSDVTALRRIRRVWRSGVELDRRLRP